MTGLPKDDFPSEDIVFRLRAKMEDHSYTVMTEGTRKLLAFRVPGEKIDLLRSLEYLSEFLEEGALDGVEKVLLISDKEYEVTPGGMMEPKMETKRKDDDRLFSELKSKLRVKLEPLVFTEENDILELYRTAIRMDGSVNRTDSSVGLDLLKISLPPEGDVIYLIFDDGYKKMSKATFEKLSDDAMQGLREGPSLAKDPIQKGMARSTSLSKEPRPPSGAGGGYSKPNDARTGRKVETATHHADDPKVLLRELSRNLVSLGYRKDTVFSRPDVDQLFFVGMSGPALFVKVLMDGEELPSFLRVLEHRRDALGILVTRSWDPRMEAISRTHGFVYLDWQRAWRTHEVVREVLKEGGD